MSATSATSATPVQGRELLRDCNPRSRTPTETAADDISRAPPANSTATPSPPVDWPLSPEPPSPTKQPSPLRQPVSHAGSDGVSIPSPRSSDQIPQGPADMSFTGDNRKAAGPPDDSRQQGRPGPWPTRSRPEAVRTGDADATPTKVRSPPTAGVVPGSPGRLPKVLSPSTASRFSFFTSSMSALRGFASSPAAVPQDDELLQLDIEAALFPAGAPAEGDAFSPAAFKNLHMNAAGLLRKFQTAYRRRSTALEELKAEREAQDDEKSEMETRTRHLKMQLEGMAKKAAENESIMQALMGELSKEKMLRMEEREAREKKIMPSNMSTVSEDLGAEEDQRRSVRRRSAETAKSDPGSDTDEESIEGASVFSRCRSPTLTASTSDAGHMESMSPPTHQAKPALLGPPRAARQPQPHMSAFQKLFKGMASEAPKDDDPRSAYRCRNCQGQDASVAWDTASLLRDENRGLKQRVGELEAAVEEALDAVIGIGL